VPKFKSSNFVSCWQPWEHVFGNRHMKLLAKWLCVFCQELQPTTLEHFWRSRRSSSQGACCQRCFRPSMHKPPNGMTCCHLLFHPPFNTPFSWTAICDSNSDFYVSTDEWSCPISVNFRCLYKLVLAKLSAYCISSLLLSKNEKRGAADKQPGFHDSKCQSVSVPG
jgi:hypothetical protein